jgi:glycosyltransferase involved in cell wall biosynthesis
MVGSGRAPLVSVVLPVFNGAATIGRAVASILGQTLADIELVVLDDASTDDTSLVLRGIHDERMRVTTNQQRQGLVVSLNAGVEMASSGVIGRMDADDVAHPDRLALEFGLFRAYPQVGLVATAYTVVDADGHDLGYVGVPPDHASVALGLLFGCCLAHATVMFRRDVFRLVGGYRAEEFPSEDYGLWLRMVEITQVATVPSAQLTYLRSEKGLSSTLRNRQTERTLELAGAAIEHVIGKRPPERIVAGLTGLGPPLGCADCDEALGDVLSAYKEVRRASRARKAPRADLHGQLPGLVLRCGMRDPDGLLCRACLVRMALRHPRVAARLATRRLRRE